MNTLVFCSAFLGKACIVSQLFSGGSRVCCPVPISSIVKSLAPCCPEESGTSYLAAVSAVTRRLLGSSVWISFFFGVSISQWFLYFHF